LLQSESLKISLIVFTMATVSELTTLLEAALDYEETASLSKAKSVITYVNQLLLKRPQSSGHAGSSVSYDTATLQQLRDDARVYVKAKSTTSAAGVRFLGPSATFRG